MSQTYNNNRAEGTIDLSKMGVPKDRFGDVSAMVVGSGGSGIRRYTKTEPGSYVKVYNHTCGKDAKTKVTDCDTVYISARSAEAVKKLGGLITQDIKAFFDPNVVSSRPQIHMDCPGEVVGTIIGRGGDSKRKLEREIGDGCYIVHNRETGKFDISADTDSACQRAKMKIESRITKFYKDQSEYKRTVQLRETKSLDSSSTNSFSLLGVSDTDSDGEDLVEKVEAKKAKQTESIRNSLFQEDKSSYSSTSSEDKKYRWEIREELSKRKTESGDYLYPDYMGKDYKTGKPRMIEGVYAVPWDAVDDEIEKRKSIGRSQETSRFRKAREAAMESQRQSIANGSASFPEINGSKTPSMPIQCSWKSSNLSKVKDGSSLTQVPTPPPTSTATVPSQGMMTMKVVKKRRPKAPAPMDLSEPISKPLREPSPFLELPEDMDDIIESPVNKTAERSWWDSDEDTSLRTI